MPVRAFRLPSLSTRYPDLTREPANSLSGSTAGEINTLMHSTDSLHSSSGNISPVSLSSNGTMSEGTGPETLEHLMRLNASLLSVLRAERERCSALEAALLRATGSASSAAEASPAVRPTSTPVRGALRILSTNASSGSLVSSRSFGSKLSRRGPKRTRVDPKTGPLRAGALLSASIDSAALPVTPLPAPLAAADGNTSWPEPCSSPPTKSSTPRCARWPKVPAASGSSSPQLSAALTTRARQALADELQRLQERLQLLLTGAPAPDGKAYATAVHSLARRLGWVRSDAAALQALAPSADAAAPAATPASDGADVSGSLEAAQTLASSRCDDLQALYELAENTEAFVVSLRGELCARDRAEAERMHAERVCAESGLRVLRVARDGDCLFSCAHGWLTQRIDEPASDAELEAAATTPEAAARAERTLAALASGSATEVRALTMHTLRDLAVSQSEGEDGENVAKAIEAAVAAARSGATDATSNALCAALERHRASTADAGSAAATLEAYLEVMGTPGIYGERLEILALSALARSPVHLYYFLEAPEGGAPADGALSATAPTEVVTAPGVAADAEPLRLLHRVCDRHFDLLLPSAAVSEI